METTTPTIVEALRRWPWARSFAVIDGALAEGIGPRLAAIGVRSKSLFLEQADQSLRDSGPHLVAVERGGIDRILGFRGVPAATVFWGGDFDELQLFRHLRTINFVEIPDGEAVGEDRYERVMFRHWDPSVLGMILPVLSVAQQIKLFGPATVVLMMNIDDGTVAEIRGPDGGETTKGLMRFTPRQMEEIARTMQGRSDARLVKYLRETAPDDTRSVSDVTIVDFAKQAAISGRQIGLTTERSFGRWAYLILLTRGKVTESQEITNHISRAEEGPDRGLEKLMAQTAKSLATRGAA